MSSACPGKHVALRLKVSLQGRNEMLDALAGCEIVDNVNTRLERRLNTFSVRNEPREVHLAYSKSKKRSPGDS